MKSSRRVVLLAMAVTIVGINGAAASLRKKWAFNISGQPGNASAAALPAIEVYAVSFSPNGRRIAASIGPAGREAVLVIDAMSPESNPTRIDINPTGQERTSPSPLSWSPSGTHILVGRRVIELLGGQTCLLPPRDFTESKFMAGAIVARQQQPRRLRSLDLSCRATADIDLGNDLWNIFDVSPNRGLLLVWWQHYIGPASVDWDLSLVAGETGKSVKRLPLLAGARFLDDGRIICGVQGAQWHRTVECLDADTARPLAKTREWNAPQIQTARSAKRAIVSDYRRKFDWIDLVWRVGSLKNRTVWDFATGASLVSWRPKTQAASMGPLPFEVSLSPNGDFLLEGGEGVLSLYKIEP